MIGAMNYTEDTQVFVLMAPGRCACLVDLSAARQWGLAFTTQDKAKEFMRKVPTDADRVLPCTLGEWFGWQDAKGLPDLAIDPDPLALRDHPLRIDADPAKHDIQCVTREHLGVKSFEVTVRKREDRRS